MTDQIGADYRGKLARHSVSILVLQLVGKGISFSTVSLLAHQLGVASFGVFSTTLAVVFIVQTVVGLGTNEFATRKTARGELLDALWTPVIVLRLIVALIGLVAAIVFAVVSGVDTPWVIFTFALSIVPTTLTQLYYAKLTGEQKFTQVSVLILINTTCQLAFTVLGFIVLGPSLLVAAYAYLATALVSLILPMLMYPVHVSCISTACLSLNTYRQILNESLPFLGLAVIIPVYYKADMLILQRIGGPVPTGQYAAAYRIIDALMFLPATFTGILFPVFSRLTRANEQRLAGAILEAQKHMLRVCLPVGLALMYFTPLIVKLIFGQDFVESVKPLRILLIAWLVICFDGSMPAALNAAMGARRTLMVTLGGIAINLCTTIPLIVVGRDIGAAIATVITEIILAVVYILIIQRQWQYRLRLPIDVLVSISLFVLSYCYTVLLPEPNLVIGAVVVLIAIMTSVGIVVTSEDLGIYLNILGLSRGDWIRKNVAIQGKKQ